MSGESKKKHGTPNIGRRTFVRRSAEVAALSLFGTVGLDSVVQKVAQRLKDKRGADNLADRLLTRVGTAEASGGNDDPIEKMLFAGEEGDSCPS